MPCVRGIETGYLIKQGANVVGLDISEKNVDEYKRIWGKPCFMNSIHNTKFWTTLLMQFIYVVDFIMYFLT